MEPLFKEGEIDLEKGCTCRFFLDDNEIYKGDVNGKGTIDLTEQHFDCGNFAPGESHTLRCDIIWHELDVQEEVDRGWRFYDSEGEHILVPGEEDAHVEGEIEFKWIFYAQTDEAETDDSKPGIGGDTGDPDSNTSDAGGGSTVSGGGGGSSSSTSSSAV